VGDLPTSAFKPDDCGLDKSPIDNSNGDFDAPFIFFQALQNGGKTNPVWNLLVIKKLISQLQLPLP
jgi:hypothetical protein